MTTSEGPLHVQVEEALRARIDGRELQPGDLLPSESSLCELHGVSRSVVRQALASLEAAGLVSKSRGRGTVVTEQRQVHRDVRRPGLRWRAEVVEDVRTAVVAWEVEARPGHLAELPGPDVVRVDRVRSVGGRPVSIIRTWLPLDVAEVLSPELLADDSLHRLLDVRLGRPVAGGRSQIRAVAATDDHARSLGVSPGAPLLLLEGANHDARGEVLEMFSTWHRADTVAFDVDTTPVGDGGPGAPPVRGDDHEVVRRLDALTAQVAALQAGLDRLR